MDIFLASVKLSFNSSEKIKFDFHTSKLFKKQIVDSNLQFICIYRRVSKIVLPNTIHDFSGHSIEETKIPYEWKIYKSDDELFIHIDFFKNDTICEVLPTINFFEKTISLDILPHTLSQITLDPLFHPLGSLLMIYLSHFSSGFLIHASGIKENNNGYIFSGVSGIGKTTMSELWLKQGATVINDDRI
jgi:hypothetical protein